MLHVCDIFAVDYDLKFNPVKSVMMRVGPCFNVDCASLMLAGQNFMYVAHILNLQVAIEINR